MSNFARPWANITPTPIEEFHKHVQECDAEQRGWLNSCTSREDYLAFVQQFGITAEQMDERESVERKARQDEYDEQVQKFKEHVRENPETDMHLKSFRARCISQKIYEQTGVHHLVGFASTGKSTLESIMYNLFEPPKETTQMTLGEAINSYIEEVRKNSMSTLLFSQYKAFHNITT